MESQVSLHSFLAKASELGADPFVKELATQQTIERVLWYCWCAWTAEEKHERMLGVGKDLIVWYA